VSPYFALSPLGNTLQVAGVQRMERNNFGSGRTFDILIEGVFPLGRTDMGAQRLLDRLLVEQAVDTAVESDATGGGALFSRMADTGTITTDSNAPAANDVAFVEYLGVSRDNLRTGGEALFASWVVQVLT
jgi:hypothetical protein